MCARSSRRRHHSAPSSELVLGRTRSRDIKTRTIKNKRRDSPKTNYLPKTSMTRVRDRRRTNVLKIRAKGLGVGRCDYGSYLGPRVDGRGGAGGRQGYHPVVPLVCGKVQVRVGVRGETVYPPYSAWGRNARRGPLRVRCISQRGGSAAQLPSGGEPSERALRRGADLVRVGVRVRLRVRVMVSLCLG